uniref:Uncharacterized protein n=1 Tax=Romanomermis culicivorax TaxID=13658 RepID=A0A915L1Z6_ROMCU
MKILMIKLKLERLLKPNPKSMMNAEQLRLITVMNDDEEILLDDAQKDPATQQEKNGRFESIGNLNSLG